LWACLGHLQGVNSCGIIPFITKHTSKKFHATKAVFSVMPKPRKLQPFSQLGTHYLFDTGFDISNEDTPVVKLVRVTYVIRNEINNIQGTMCNTMK